MSYLLPLAFALTWREIVFIVAIAVCAICVGLIADMLPKHIRWNKENRS